MEKLYLYNTLTRLKEEFKPIKRGSVGFYHCGPTVYWTQHIGNLRGMLCGDIIVRSLRYFGYKVNHVRNYTDVGHLTSDQDEGEDKMAKAVKRDKETPEKIAEKYIKIFENDTIELNLLEPNKKPQATKHVGDMIKMVKTLLDKGFAYSTDLAVYFDVAKAKNYGQLSGQNLEDKITGAGKGEVNDPGKKHQADFALWFFKAGAHAKALQSWPSPFKSNLAENGQGFPGWHIECSAMSKKILGSTIDMHLGGIEHIPVHHTNEIAQSEAANGVKFVNYWLHNEHLLVDNKKMAKSEGTSFSLAEVKEKGFSPLDLRYFFLQAHYRSKQNFTWEALASARNGLEHLYNQVRELGEVKGKIDKLHKEKFIQALADDFNAPQALAVLQELLKADMPDKNKLATILDFDKVLGLNLAEILIKEKVPANVKNLVDARNQARQEKNWAESDRLRDEVAKLGYMVEDTKDGQRVIKK
jgi:cysteinyl-tRNA synthetase